MGPRIALINLDWVILNVNVIKLKNETGNLGMLIASIIKITLYTAPASARESLE